ncbi:hypothetical protein [Ferrimicrobium acidiphilum]|uniref:DUF4232 domain-containing protein n=1 Tax=Ferrimicrobium acidiphilum TaxID=121039 RepID=A0ABV3Y384_9ACTN
MVTYRSRYRRAFAAPVVLGVVFVVLGLFLGQALGSHQRLVNQQQECRASQVGISVRSTQSNTAFSILTIRPHQGVTCTLGGYPTLVGNRANVIPIEHLGPQLGLNSVTVAATHRSPMDFLIAPATLPYAIRLPHARGLVVIDHNATTTPKIIAVTPVFAGKNLETIQSLATTDLAPAKS